MATNSTTVRRSLYPPEHPRKRERYYFDDTLDAYPPYHLFRGKPTPEAMEAAKRLAAKRGYPPPHFPPDTDDGYKAPAPAASSANGALTEPPKRSAAPSRARKK
ncbi:MAG: hypothetical protein HY332_17340 [Chloroflexi bacterium]|nr:hypothetical protein [Chloroflexota bacterium]